MIPKLGNFGCFTLKISKMSQTKPLKASQKVSTNLLVASIAYEMEHTYSVHFEYLNQGWSSQYPFILHMLSVTCFKKNNNNAS